MSFGRWYKVRGQRNSESRLCRRQRGLRGAESVILHHKKCEKDAEVKESAKSAEFPGKLATGVYFCMSINDK